MNQHALDVLEYADALDLVARHASSTLGASAVRSLAPSALAEAADRELCRVQQLADFLEEVQDWAAPPIPDLRGPLRRLDLDGSVLDGSDLWNTAELIRSGRFVREILLKSPDDYPLLAQLVAGLEKLDREEKLLRRAVDESGDLRDQASGELARIRRAIRGERNRIVARLERFAATLSDRARVPDGSISLREGRYVVPVRREARGEVGGIVHDESSTGNTLFIEPTLAVDLMNRLRGLERAEARETQRLLRELTELIRPWSQALRHTLDVLVDLDSLLARVRYRNLVDGHRPELVPEGGGYVVVDGRHPLLLDGNQDVVPFDLELDPGQKTLVVSGPNTGGKTVLLKAIGLISLLAQAGVIPPVGKGTRLPLFQDFYADIGDEQSIEASLSTFSAHLRNLREILELAGARSLVLIDEIGSGTDPLEGGALARAILLELNRRGVLTVATSHLGELKLLATREPGIVNASLQFDSEELRPTYRLLKGVPGRSYGLPIARRLGFPPGVLDQAESLLPDQEKDVGRLLLELEEKERRLEQTLREAEAMQAKALELRSRLEDWEAELSHRERAVEADARGRARELLLKAREDVDAVISRLREAAADTAAAQLDEASREARRQVEALAKQQAEAVPAAEEEQAAGGNLPAPGNRVRIASTGAKGVLLEARDGKALVDVGGMRLQVPAADVEPTSADAASHRQPGTRSGGWKGPDLHVSTEVDLRGLRAEEVAGMLGPAIDAAATSGLRTLRIIHGKGTGVLRQVVSEQLESDPRVKRMRAGGPGEGGIGVTVAEFV